MKQQRDGGVYNPDALNVMQKAFNEAWSVVRGNYASDAANSARLRLAKALLSTAHDNSHDAHDVDALKWEALKAMALSYRSSAFDVGRLATTETQAISALRPGPG